MIIPSIDLMGGEAVQLVGGKEKALSAGAPQPLLQQFSLVAETAVIDLDAALNQGNNEELIRKLVEQGPCRVGGGIRDLETARRWLDAGAKQIILGTKAVPELLRELPRERLIAALDAENGEIVVEGWRTKTGKGIIEKISELREFVSGFLVTFVEREGRLQGTNLSEVEAIVKAAGDCRVTIAGGVSTAEEIAALDKLGADAQVGMALYTKKLSLAEAFLAPVKSERADGLIPTVVSDEGGKTLGLCWSNLESIQEALRTTSGVYFSRRRGLWRKGESSGNQQKLLKIAADCDRDALQFTVQQSGKGFCHLAQRSCFGGAQGLSELFRVLEKRKLAAPEGSYTKRLFADANLLKAKLLEEAREVTEASGREHLKEELADLMYFAAATAVRNDISFEEIEQCLDMRSLKVTRRPGNAK